MDKITCLRGVVDRLIAVITFRGQRRHDGASLWRVEALQSAQAGESYAKQVMVLPAHEGSAYIIGGRVPTGYEEIALKELGSKRGDIGTTADTYFIGDGSQAILQVTESGDLTVTQSDYDSLFLGAGGKWNGATEPRRLCGLDDIVKMEFETTSGWRGECYPERVADREDNWIVVLHRSTGAVTIERSFPF